MAKRGKKREGRQGEATGGKSSKAIREASKDKARRCKRGKARRKGRLREVGQGSETRRGETRRGEGRHSLLPINSSVFSYLPPTCPGLQGVQNSYLLQH